jgi:hypothetical protein
VCLRGFDHSPGALRALERGSSRNVVADQTEDTEGPEDVEQRMELLGRGRTGPCVAVRGQTRIGQERAAAVRALAQGEDEVRGSAEAHQQPIGIASWKPRTPGCRRAAWARWRSDPCPVETSGSAKVRAA